MDADTLAALDRCYLEAARLLMACSDTGEYLERRDVAIAERLFDDPRVCLYTGRVDGEVVSTSMLVATEGIGAIYWVATLESQRGCGYGEALTWAAMRGGQQRNCRIASLQASKLGRPVYERMGFARVLDYVRFAGGPPA